MIVDSPREVWQAPAKINLWLRITGRRPDGYHMLDTGLQTISLSDRVTLARSDGGVTCEVAGPASRGVPADDSNLAARAAAELGARTGRELRVGLELEKSIPAGSGLGGGSSDAAAVLMALAHRFAVPDPEHTLHDLALSLGADVPFLLEGGTQWVVGVGGEGVALCPPDERWGILVIPDVSISTEWAYRAWDESGAGPSPPEVRESAQFGAQTLPDDWRERGNDLEAVVFGHHDEVGDVFTILSDGPRTVVRMSGTGSSVFALYTSSEVRDEDLRRVQSGCEGIGDVAVHPFECIDHGVRMVE